MKMVFKFLSVFAVILYATPAMAEYYVIGPIKGESCWGFGFKVCKIHTISAYLGKDGKLHAMPRVVLDADYRARDGHCWVGNRGGTIIGGGLYEKLPSGKYEKVDIDTVLSFKCRKM